jgi:hypothetical protein
MTTINQARLYMRDFPLSIFLIHALHLKRFNNHDSIVFLMEPHLLTSIRFVVEP